MGTPLTDGDHILRAPHIVTSETVHTDGWLAIHDGRVHASGSGELPRSIVNAPISVVHGPVFPGAVDIHAHGALGHDFTTATEQEARLIVEHHRRRGTTTMLASIATAPLNTMRAAIRRLHPLVADGTLAGIHLEGPYLAHGHRGAHAPDLLRLPVPEEALGLVRAGASDVRVMTIAPELPGAMETITELTKIGVTAAIGHTDCDTETAHAAIDAGARLATHLFNGMPPLLHRTPGPVGAALADNRVSVELIADGHHIHPDVITLVMQAAGNRLVLVSDAMSATGSPDGAYTVAGSQVTVRDGIATTGDSLAGSTITVTDAVARLLASGADLQITAAASSAHAAALLHRPAPLSVGADADLVVLDAVTHQPNAVMRRGTWVESSL